MLTKRLPKRLKLTFLSSILPAAAIYIIALVLTQSTKESLVVSLATAVMGWTNSIILSGFDFNLNEASKGKDTAALHTERFFDELEMMFNERSLTEDTLESVVAARVSLLEVRLSHIKSRTGFEILTPEQLAAMRSKPIDILNSPNYKSELAALKFDLLETIEHNYSEWVKI